MTTIDKLGPAFVQFCRRIRPIRVEGPFEYPFYHHVRSYAYCPFIRDLFKVIVTEVPETVMIFSPKASIRLLDNFGLCHHQSE